MTAADTSTVATDVEVEHVDLCSVCNHAMSAHDRTAGRYCDATQANALSRKCICHG